MPPKHDPPVSLRLPMNPLPVSLSVPYSLRALSFMVPKYVSAMNLRLPQNPSALKLRLPQHVPPVSFRKNSTTQLHASKVRIISQLEASADPATPQLHASTTRTTGQIEASADLATTQLHASTARTTTQAEASTEITTQLPAYKGPVITPLDAPTALAATLHAQFEASDMDVEHSWYTDLGDYDMYDAFDDGASDSAYSDEEEVDDYYLPSNNPIKIPDFSDYEACLADTRDNLAIYEVLVQEIGAEYHEEVAYLE